MATQLKKNRSVIIQLICFGILTLPACRTENPSSQTGGADMRFDIKLGRKTIHVRLACAEKERQQGLMNVKSMPENEGMIFLGRKAEQQGFWMKNTLIPLDIGYFTGDGILREIHPMYPRNTDPVRSRRNDIRYALEMNQGWFRKNGLVPGMKLDLEDLEAALKTRGKNPRQWMQ